MSITIALLIVVAAVIALGRTGHLRDALLWLRARPWLLGLMAAVVAALGLAAWARRREAATVAPSSLALRLHELEVRRRELALNAGKAHREEMADIRRRAEEQRSLAERIRLDRDTVLREAHIDDALREMRERAVELGLRP